MLLPAHFDFDQKYDIFELLWRNARPKEISRVTINSNQGIDNPIVTVTASLETALEKDFPQEVKDIVAWLAEDDVHPIQDPAAKLNLKEQVGVIRYMVGTEGWKGPQEDESVASVL